MDSATDIIKRMQAVLGAEEQYELAHFLSIQPQSVSQAIKRNKIPPQWILDFYFSRRVNPEYLAYGREPKLIGNSQLVNFVTRSEVSGDTWNTPPLVDAVLTENGGYRPLPIDWNWIALDAAWIEEQQLAPAALFTLRCEGDHMMPEIAPRDLVVFNTDQTEPIPHRLYVVRIDNTLAVYRLLVNFGNIILRSTNPAYSEHSISRECIQSPEFSIQGQVIAVARRFQP